MVLVHRIDGAAMFVNPDLIESVEALEAGTRLTLVDGRSLDITDAPATVADRIRDFRAAVLVEAERQAAGNGATLTVLPREG